MLLSVCSSSSTSRLSFPSQVSLKASPHHPNPPSTHPHTPQLAFDPQAIVIADFRPTTAAGDALDPQAFQRALQGYLKANGTTGFQVTAFAAAPSPDDYTFLPQDAASKERQRALFASSLANDEFPLTHPIRAVFVVRCIALRGVALPCRSFF